MKYLILLIALSACASQPIVEKMTYSDPSNRPHTQQVSDLEYCTLYSRTVKASLEPYEMVNCMERRGYKTNYFDRNGNPIL